MALSKAIEFVHAVSISQELRTACSNFSKEKLLIKMNFSENEFEDALNSQLVQCQTYEQAEVFQQIRMWFLLL
jgi:hypothetical protein